MNQEITIVDRGRGLQLSTSRVTVQDLVPYFQEGSSYDEIIANIPTLTVDEIAVVEKYYREHQAALDEEDGRIRERSAQRRNPPWVEKLLEEGKAKNGGVEVSVGAKQSQRRATVKGVLADVNIEGYVDRLVARMQVDPWKLFWDHLQIQYLRFADVGLKAQSPDSLVWQTCQDNDLALVTDNRNQSGPDSSARTMNTPATASRWTAGGDGDAPAG
jgi:hypothetical protein